MLWAIWPGPMEYALRRAQATLSKDMAPVALLWGVFILWRFFVALLKGQTLGQWAWGLCRKDGNALWRRLSGSTEAALGSVFIPLPLGPALSYVSRPWGALLLAWALWPALALLAPMALLWGDREEFHYRKTQITLPNIDKGQNFDQFAEYESHFWGLSFFSNLHTKGYFFFPGLEIKKRGQRLAIVPILSFYDHKRGALGKMKVFRNFPRDWVWPLAKQANPLFSLRYPELKDWPLDEIFSLSYASFPRAVLDMGPFLHGPLALRERILKLAGPGPGETLAQRVSINSQSFLRLKRGPKEVLLGLGGTGVMIRLFWEGPYKKTQAEFESHFLSTLRPFSSTPQGGVLMAMDALMAKGVAPETQKLILPILKEGIQFYKKHQAPILKMALLETLNRLIFLAQKDQSPRPSVVNSLGHLKEKLL